MMEIPPTSCSIFSTSVLCLEGLFFLQRRPFFILLSICSFSESLRVSWPPPPPPTFFRPSRPPFSSYVKAPLFNLTSLILFFDIIVLEGERNHLRNAPRHAAEFSFPPPLNRLPLRTTNVCETISIPSRGRWKSARNYRVDVFPGLYRNYVVIWW